MGIDGAIAVALVDYNSGMSLGMGGDPARFAIEVAAAGNTEVVRSKMKVMAALGLRDRIEDILITLGQQYHIIRIVRGDAGLFLYLVLNKSISNLAMARHQLSRIEQELTAA